MISFYVDIMLTITIHIEVILFKSYYLEYYQCMASHVNLLGDAQKQKLG